MVRSRPPPLCTVTGMPSAATCSPRGPFRNRQWTDTSCPCCRWMRHKDSATTSAPPVSKLLTTCTILMTLLNLPDGDAVKGFPTDCIHREQCMDCKGSGARRVGQPLIFGTFFYNKLSRV